MLDGEETVQIACGKLRWDGLQGRSLSRRGAKLGEAGLGTPPVQIKEEHDLTAQDQDLRNRNHSGHPMKYVNCAASEYSY